MRTLSLQQFERVEILIEGYPFSFWSETWSDSAEDPKLAKIGIHAQDTCELFFDDVLVPANNVLGEVDRGFNHLVKNLPRERLSLAIGAIVAVRGPLLMVQCQ